MRQPFIDVMAYIESELKGGEDCIGTVDGESSEFVRFNHGLVRQAGAVRQQNLSFRLIKGKKHCVGTFPLGQSADANKAAARYWLENLRQTLAVVADDPFFSVPPSVQSTEQIRDGSVGDSGEVIETIAKDASGLDFVGILAQGSINRGYYSSYGQRNWFETKNFHLDWSLYLTEDKALKQAYAGAQFIPARFGELIASGARELGLLGRTSKSLKPGRYRVYLAPSALGEIFELLSWGGFARRNLETKQSPLSRLAAGAEKLHPEVFVAEDMSLGHGPIFNDWGFLRPQKEALIEGGLFQGALISPRTEKEFGLAHNSGANGQESPEALVMQGGSVPARDVLKTLDTGLYINNLWYLNYSDRVHCRMTGMTRFACFWVENGEIVAPTNVMRFDETLYRMLGSHLEGLTRESQLLLSASTYGGRATGFKSLPGAIVNDFALTL